MAAETMNPAECGLKEQKQERYVDINPAIEFLEGYDNSWGQEFADGVRFAVRHIKKLAAADVQEVKHGKWDMLLSLPPRYRCSECLTITDFAYTYCPHCGAKMDGKENE